MHNRSKSIFLGCLVAVFLSTAALAEQSDFDSRLSPQRTMEVSLNVFQFLFLYLSGEYQIKVADHLALTVPVSLSLLGGGISSSSGTAFAVWGGLGVRYFLTAPVFQSSWYISPELQLGYQRLSTYGSTLSVIPYLVFGYNWVLDNGMSFALGLGVQYRYTSANVSGSDVWLHGVLPSGEASIGYAW